MASLGNLHPVCLIDLSTQVCLSGSRATHLGHVPVASRGSALDFMVAVMIGIANGNDA